MAPLTCNNLPDLVDDHRACEDARATTAAPLPVFAALLTGRAWPAVGGLLTSEVEWHQADPVGKGYLKQRELHAFQHYFFFFFAMRSAELSILCPQTSTPKQNPASAVSEVTAQLHQLPLLGNAKTQRKR